MIFLFEETLLLRYIHTMRIEHSHSTVILAYKSQIGDTVEIRARYLKLLGKALLPNSQYSPRPSIYTQLRMLALSLSG
jgi:hypothetical protein